MEGNEIENLNNTEDEPNDEGTQKRTKAIPIMASPENVQHNENQSHDNTPTVGCQNGGEPGGAHRCIECEKAVHILPCCSISIGDEEGYGEKRLCNACAGAQKTLETQSSVPPVSQAVSEMAYNETWNKKKEKKESKYLKPAPNWNLNNNIQKKVKLGILQNGNLKNTTYRINKQTVALTNTCSFDSTCQVNVI